MCLFCRPFHPVSLLPTCAAPDISPTESHTRGQYNNTRQAKAAHIKRHAKTTQSYSVQCSTIIISVSHLNSFKSIFPFKDKFIHSNNAPPTPHIQACTNTRMHARARIHTHAFFLYPSGHHSSGCVLSL